MNARQGRGRGTVAGAVTRRDDVLGEYDSIEQRVKKGSGYYQSVSPSHVSGDSYANVIVGHLRRKPDLATAVMSSPYAVSSFLGAVAECARLGLEPGQTYHFVAFEKWDQETRRRTGIYDIVGMTDYKGEIELMYRSGSVQNVICEVVHERDAYVPGEHPHEAPRFKKAGGPFAGAEQRGVPVGVFAYAILDTGAISRVVEIGRDEVMAHREVAKTKKVWDGPFGLSQWRKVAIKELRKWVPTSPEYRRETARIAAVAGELPPAALREIGADIENSEYDLPPLMPGEGAAGNGHRALSGRAEPDEPGGGPVRQQTVQAIWRRLTGAFGYADDSGDQAAADCGVIAGRPVRSAVELTETEGTQILKVLDTCEQTAARGEDTPAGVLAAYLAERRDLPAGAKTGLVTPATAAKITETLGEITDDIGLRSAALTQITGRDVAEPAELTRAEGSKVVTALRKITRNVGPDLPSASDQLATLAADVLARWAGQA